MEYQILKSEEMVVDKSRLWRDRAEECRTLAAGHRRQETKKTLLGAGLGLRLNGRPRGDPEESY